MLKAAPLMRSFLMVASNAKLPATKLQLTVGKLLEQGVVENKTTRTDENFAELIDVTIRIVLSWFRIIAGSDTDAVKAKHIVYRKLIPANQLRFVCGYVKT